MRFIKNAVAACLLLAGLSACATAPQDAEDAAYLAETGDSIESINRGIFAFNLAVDKAILRPAASVYIAVLPEPARDGVGNVLNNLGQPVRFANAVLQGRMQDAGDIMGRFMVNSTIGVVGLFDVASAADVPSPQADFGQTLYAWGWKDPGTYLMLPLLGPSNVRDAIGTVAQSFADPWSYTIQAREGNGWRNGYLIATNSLSAIDKRAANFDAINQLEKDSIDFYATVRSIHKQFRTRQLEGRTRAGESEYNRGRAPSKKALPQT